MTTETWKHGFANTNGIRLHYVEQGEGPLMLLLHISQFLADLKRE